MKKTLLSIAALAGLWAVSAAAVASIDPTIPEPGVLGMLVAAGIVGAVIAIRKRRK